MIKIYQIDTMEDGSIWCEFDRVDGDRYMFANAVLGLARTWGKYYHDCDARKFSLTDLELTGHGLYFSINTPKNMDIEIVERITKVLWYTLKGGEDVI